MSQVLCIRSPYDGHLVGEVPVTSVRAAIAEVERLADYRFDVPSAERERFLHKAADLLAARRPEFAHLISRESGNALSESEVEVDRAALNLRIAAEEAQRLSGSAIPVAIAGTQRLAVTRYCPVGLVFAITPFNRPLNQIVVKLAPALAANNPVLIKPSEKTPLTALKFADLLREAGVPEAMFGIVVGPPAELAAAIIRHPVTKMVTFTGSVEAGKAVAGLAGYKTVALELGGNDPLIVLPDAPIEHAARLAAKGAYANAGQSCRGIKRILVFDEVADAFAAALRRETEEWTFGDPLSTENRIGCLIDAAAADRVDRRVRSAVAAGADLLVGGDRDLAVYAPTVLDRVSPGAEVVLNETFGPIAPIIRVSSIPECVSVANGTAYGLQAGVVTNNFEWFQAIADRLEVGGVAMMDGPNFESPFIPFGGVKDSGLRREGIPFAMREMSTIKTIVLPWKS